MQIVLTNTTTRMVNIKGLNKEELLRRMISGTVTNVNRPFWGLQQGDSIPKVIAFIDYQNDVKIGIDFRYDDVNSFAYNRDANQPGKMERIVEQMRKEEEEYRRQEQEQEQEQEHKE
jgi:hypothetical protein